MKAKVIAIYLHSMAMLLVGLEAWWEGRQYADGPFEGLAYCPITVWEEQQEFRVGLETAR